MNGASAEPCVATIRAPNTPRIEMIGSSQNFLRSHMKAHSSRTKSFIVTPLSSEFYLRASDDSGRNHREDIGAGQLGAPVEQMPVLGEQRVRLSGRATRQDEQPGQHGKQERRQPPASMTRQPWNRGHAPLTGSCLLYTSD